MQQDSPYRLLINSIFTIAAFHKKPKTIQQHRKPRLQTRNTTRNKQDARNYRFFPAMEFTCISEVLHCGHRSAAMHWQVRSYSKKKTKKNQKREEEERRKNVMVSRAASMLIAVLTCMSSHSMIVRFSSGRGVATIFLPLP